MKVDIHAHLAGAGSEGSGCWLSPAFGRRASFRALRWLFGVSDEQLRTTADGDWAALLAARVRGSELDRAVALGFDGVYSLRDGRPDRERSQMIVPPSWVFEVCRRHPELLPGPSVNPHRRDALERLEECVEGGAVLLKWLPATMGIDPAHHSLAPFYRRLAETGIPLLVHSGGSERTFAEVDPRLADLSLLLAPLRAGVSVVVAHAGAPVHLSRDADQRPLLRRWLDEFPGLWIDNSGMANPARFRHLPRILDDPAVAERTLYGSDFPVLTNAVWYARRLGAKRVVELERERNSLQRDVALKRFLGFGDETLTRAARVLPTLGRWIRA